MVFVMTDKLFKNTLFNDVFPCTDKLFKYTFVIVVFPKTDKLFIDVLFNEVFPATDKLNKDTLPYKLISDLLEPIFIVFDSVEFAVIFNIPPLDVDANRSAVSVVIPDPILKG